MVPTLAGRPLDVADATTSAPVPVVVTQSLAERLWPRGDALGKTFNSQPRFPPACLVVGIAADFAFGTLAKPVNGVIVIARGDFDYRVSNFALRTDDPEALAGAIPRLLHDRVLRIATGREVIARDIGRQRLGAWIFSGFGLVALLLGVGGVYGLVTYLAEARRHDFGVRMAMGASLSNIIWRAMTSALRPVAAGVGVGLVAGAIGSRVLASTLIGISNFDAGTYAGVGVVMLLPAALSALAAASRLRTLSPADALRQP